MTRLGDLLGAQLGPATITTVERYEVEEEVSVSQAAAELGEGREGVSALARRLHAENPEGPKYKSVRRQIERYIKGERGEGGETRNPGKGYKTRIRRIVERERSERNESLDTFVSAGMSVDISGTLEVSSDVRYRDLPTLSISPGEAAEIMNAYESGNVDGAADMVWRFAVWGDYGVAGLIPAMDATPRIIGDSDGSIDTFIVRPNS